jgi:hypothetical protein
LVWFLHGGSPFLGKRKFALAYQGLSGESLLSTIYRAFPDAPDTSYSNDLLYLIDRGDVDQMTAAFFILEYHWETINDTRCCVVTRGELVAVSVSTFSLFVGAGCSVAAAIAQAKAQGFREGRAAGIKQARQKNAGDKRVQGLMEIQAAKPQGPMRAENMIRGTR